jgi:type I restriction enzyme, S subunit
MPAPTRKFCGRSLRPKRESCQILARRRPQWNGLDLRPARDGFSAFERGVAYTGINLEDLRELPIELPSLTEQREIVHHIETAFAWLDRVATEHANASRLLPKLNQAILAKAFRGELVLSDGQSGPLAAAERV